MDFWIFALREQVDNYSYVAFPYLSIGIWLLFEICDLGFVISQLFRYLVFWSTDATLAGVLII